MTAPFERLADLLLRRRRVIVCAFLVLVFLAGWVASGLGFDFSPQNIFVSGSADFVLLEELQEVFGRDDNVLLVVVEGPDVFSAEMVGYLRLLHDGLAAIDGIERVEDLTVLDTVAIGDSLASPLLPEGGSLEVARERALEHPLVRSRWVSEDGRAMLMSLSVAEARMDYENLAPVVEGASRVLKETTQPAGVQAALVGIPAARVLLVDRLTGDQLRFLPLCLLLFFLVLWVFFGDLRTVVVPLLAVGVTLLLVAALLVLSGEKINIINNVLPTLLFVIGASDAIHLVSRYRQEMQAGVERKTALRTAIVHLGVACFLTSITTAIGFASLAVGRLDILQRFGLFAALGVMVAYGVTIVLVPLALSTMKRPLSRAAGRANAIAERAASQVATFTVRHRYAILCVTFVLMSGAAFMATRVEVENYLFEAFPEDDALVEANRRLESRFPGIIPFTIAVRWEEGQDPLRPSVLAYLDELADFLSSVDEVGGVFSIVDVLSEINVALHGGDPLWRRAPLEEGVARGQLGTLGQLAAGGRLAGLAERFYSEEHRLLRITGSTGDIGSRALARTARTIEARLEADREIHRQLGLSCFLSGDGRVGSAAVDRLIGDLFRSLLVAFGFIFIVLIWALGSFRSALVAMVPNVFPLLLTLGLMGTLGLDLQVATVIVFSVALGLAVDDTIHFMIRFREEWAVESVEDADERYARCIERTLRGTGQAIFATSLLLAVGYSVLLLSNFPITQRFGVGMLMTVSAALIGDLLVLPACLSVFKPFAKTSSSRPEGR